jgi:hypothetical protein
MREAKLSTRLAADANFNQVNLMCGPYLAGKFCNGGVTLEKRTVPEKGSCEGPLAASRRAERGEGKIKMILVLLVIALGIYVTAKILPPYVEEYQLADKMQEQARFAIVNRYTDDQVRNNIFKVIQDLDIPAKRDDIKVTVTQSVVRISVDYTVPVDILTYHIDLHFTPSSENKSLT